MEIVQQHQTAQQVDKSLLVLTHLSQLLTYITGFGGLIVPLILWQVKKDSIIGMDEHGKQIVNFQITLLLITFLSIPAILLLGLGILSLIFACIVGFIMPIVNAVKANNNEPPSYFCTIRFIK